MITLRMIPALVISCLAAVAVSASGFVVPQASLLYNAKSALMLLQKQQKRDDVLKSQPGALSSSSSSSVETVTSATSSSQQQQQQQQQSPLAPSADVDIPSDWQTQILSALSVIIDPDLNTDIVSLGFVQNLHLDTTTNELSFDLELTTPACPVKDLFVQQCTDIILNSFQRWVSDVNITLTAQPTPLPNAASPGTPLGMSQIGAVIAVSSCKGGVGKSTTTVNLAYALSKLGAKVGIFDADVYGPSLPTMITPDDDNVRFIGRQISPLKRDGVSLMSFGYVNEGSAVMRGPMVTQLLDQFLSLTNWGPLDYLLLDMPPGTGDIQLTLSQRLNITAAVIVTTPQELSFVDVERGVEMFDTVNVPCVAVVENMAYLEREKNEEEKEVRIDEKLLREQFKLILEKEGIAMAAENGEDDDNSLVNDLVKIVQDNVQSNSNNSNNDQERVEKEEIRIFGPGHKQRLSKQYGIEHTYSIPLLGQIAKNGDSGTPYILDNPDTPQAEIYYQLAKSVVSEVAKTKFGTGRGGRPNIMYNSEMHVIEVNDHGQKVEGDDSEEVSSSLSTLSPAELRRECKCAACVEELSGKQILDPQSVSESIKPIGMSPTGNYALSVDWSDGHRSLYPYRQIRSLIVSKKEEEKKKEEESSGQEVVL